MTIGNAIVIYRQKHGLSQREFSRQCGLSNGIISMLEKGINPKTKETLVPTLPTLKLLAKGMGITVNSLIEMIDDLPISLIDETFENVPYDNSTFHLTQEEREIIEIYRNFNDDGKKELLKYAEYILTRNEYKKCSDIKKEIG